MAALSSFGGRQPASSQAGQALASACLGRARSAPAAPLRRHEPGGSSGQPCMAEPAPCSLSHACRRHVPPTPQTPDSPFCPPSWPCCLQIRGGAPDRRAALRAQAHRPALAVTGGQDRGGGGDPVGCVGGSRGLGGQRHPWFKVCAPRPTPATPPCSGPRPPCFSRPAARCETRWAGCWRRWTTPALSPILRPFVTMTSCAWSQNWSWEAPSAAS